MDQEKARMFKFAGWLLVIAAVYMAAQVVSVIKAYQFIGSDAPLEQNTISVNGEGEMFAAPDIATITFTVTEEGKTASVAQTAATKKNNEVIAFLKKSGISEGGIKTTSYTINPKYETKYSQTKPCIYPTSGAEVRVDYNSGNSIVYPPYPCPPYDGKQVIVGYEVSQMTEVKVRALDKAGDILAGIGALNVSNVYGPNFSVEDPNKVQNEARSKAILDAKEKAKTLAQELGVRLVRIVSFSESGNYPIYYAMKQYATADGGGVPSSPPSPELNPGQEKVTSNVTIVYEFR